MSATSEAGIRSRLEGMKIGHTGVVADLVVVTRWATDRFELDTIARGEGLTLDATVTTIATRTGLPVYCHECEETHARNGLGWQAPQQETRRSRQA